MTYTIDRTFSAADFASVVEKTRAALGGQGFGVLTEIDVKATMKKKIDADVADYLILGACNPGFADQVVTLEPHISTMLPCNVTIRQLPDGKHEVAAIDPAAAMGAVGNPAIEPIAAQVRDALRRVLDKI